jgi:hypothetical protein
MSNTNGGSSCTKTRSRIASSEQRAGRGRGRQRSGCSELAAAMPRLLNQNLRCDAGASVPNGPATVILPAPATTFLRSVANQFFGISTGGCATGGGIGTTLLGGGKGVSRSGTLVVGVAGVVGAIGVAGRTGAPSL